MPKPKIKPVYPGRTCTGCGRTDNAKQMFPRSWSQVHPFTPTGVCTDCCKRIVEPDDVRSHIARLVERSSLHLYHEHDPRFPDKVYIRFHFMQHFSVVEIAAICRAITEICGWLVPLGKLSYVPSPQLLTQPFRQDRRWQAFAYFSVPVELTPEIKAWTDELPKHC